MERRGWWSLSHSPEEKAMMRFAATVGTVLYLLTYFLTYSQRVSNHEWVKILSATSLWSGVRIHRSPAGYLIDFWHIWCHYWQPPNCACCARPDRSRRSKKHCDRWPTGRKRKIESPLFISLHAPVGPGYVGAGQRKKKILCDCGWMNGVRGMKPVTSQSSIRCEIRDLKPGGRPWPIT